MPCTICRSTTHNITSCNDLSILTNHTNLYTMSYMYRDLIHQGIPADNIDSLAIFSNFLDAIRELSGKMLLKLYKKYAVYVYIPNDDHPFLTLTEWYHRETPFEKQLIEPNFLKYSIDYSRSHLEVLIIQTYFNMADTVVIGIQSGLIREIQRIDYKFPIQFVNTLNSANGPCLNDDCGICWDKMTDQTRVRPSCGHAFCASCVESTLDAILQKAYNENKRPTLPCPLCRQEVNTLYHSDKLDEALIVPLVNVVQNDLS